MRLDELKQATPEQLNSWVSQHLEGYKSATQIKRILGSKVAAQFCELYGQDIYRVWGVSETTVRRLLGRKGVPGQEIKLKPKRSFLSYSWTANGAKMVAEGDAFDGIGVIVKKRIQTPKDVLFNVFQYAKEAPGKFGVELIDRNLAINEKELIVPATEYYLSIKPDEVVKVLTDPGMSY